MERRESMEDDEPLISLEQRVEPCENQTSDPHKGFTFRRCMILPLLTCYLLAGGVFVYESPQYTQQRMLQKYADEINKKNASVMLKSLHDKVLPTNHCSVNQSDPSYANYDKAQKDTAMWLMYFTLAQLIPALFANLLWSSYSDILGRRFSLIISFSGTTIRIGIFAAVVYFELDLLYLVIGAAVDGFCGAFMLLFAATFSYVSDITYPGKQRTIAIVGVELLLGVTLSIASFASGFIISDTGFFYPAFVCFCVDVLGFFILLFLVPETRQLNNSQGHSVNVFKVLAESLKFYCSSGTKIKRIKYILLMLAFLFMGMPALNRGTMEMLYQLGRPFCWDAKKIGYFGAIKTVIAAISGMGGTYIFRRCMADDTIASMSILITVGSYIVEGLAATDAILYLIPVLAMLSALPIPMIRSLMSSLTPADKQGAMFASIGFVEVLCSLIGSVSSTAVYTATLSVMNGFVFMLLALLTFIGAVFMLLFMFVNRRYKDDPVEDIVIVSDDDPSLID
ncbi:hypothetical protein ACF0H5_024507 [Mactra antiquata]